MTSRSNPVLLLDRSGAAFSPAAVSDGGVGGLRRRTAAATARRAGRHGCEDTDFGQIAARHEVPLTWLGGAWAYHQHPTTDPPVEHIEDILRNAVIFFRRWGWWPMSGWLDAFARQGLIRYDERTQRWILVDPR